MDICSLEVISILYQLLESLCQWLQSLLTNLLEFSFVGKSERNRNTSWMKRNYWSIASGELWGAQIETKIHPYPVNSENFLLVEGIKALCGSVGEASNLWDLKRNTQNDDCLRGINRRARDNSEPFTANCLQSMTRRHLGMGSVSFPSKSSCLFCAFNHLPLATHKAPTYGGENFGSIKYQNTQKCWSGKKQYLENNIFVFLWWVEEEFSSKWHKTPIILYV